MKSIITTAPYKLSCSEIAIPPIIDGAIRIKILKVGICASDIQIYHGLHKHMTYPVVQGHEGVGIVDKVGKGIDYIAPGDMVTIQPQFFCGKCYACKTGRINVCENLRFLGVTKDGLFTEYITLPAWNVVKLPKSFNVDKGMLVEPFAVGVNAIRQSCVKSGDKIVVLGAGTIGNFTAQAAKSLGAEVMITDIQEDKLALAKTHGIDYCINTKRKDLKTEINACFKGETPKVIFDCVATPAIFQQAISCAANATDIVIVGNYKEEVALDIPRLQRREITLKSVMAYNRENFMEAIGLLEANKINISGMISARFSLRDLQKGYEYIEANPRTSMRIAIEA